MATALQLFSTLFLSAGLAFSEAPRPTDSELTVDDLLKVLRVNVIKLHPVLLSDKPQMLDYWVETHYPDGTVEKVDELSIGVGGGEGLLIRLPTEENPEFGLFNAVNSMWGQSKLKVNPESAGAVEWVYRQDKKIFPDRTSIVALRIFGGEYERTTLDAEVDQVLADVLEGKYRWIDIFKVRLLQANDSASARSAHDRNDTLLREVIDEYSEKAETALRPFMVYGPKSSNLSFGAVAEHGDATIHYGFLFRPDEIAALVNIKGPPGEYDYDPVPQYLSYFVHRKGQWEFQQFLGNAYDLEIHHRKDSPSAFLQGSFRIGRYEGEHLSWYFDEKTGLLKRTNFEGYGPFVLRGDYLVNLRGFERLSHDGTFWIYEYKSGTKGRLLACYHENDSGDFDVSFPDPQIGKWRGWQFAQDREDESRMTVTVGDDREQGEASEVSFLADQSVQNAEIKGGLDPRQIFQLLTGLNPALLEGEWSDDLPPPPALEAPEYKVTGDPEIVRRLSPPPS